jgi:hypothetical protein
METTIAKILKKIRLTGLFKLTLINIVSKP